MKTLVASALVFSLAQQTLAEDPFVPQYLPPAPKPVVAKPIPILAPLLQLTPPTTINQVAQPRYAPSRPTQTAQPVPIQPPKATPLPPIARQPRDEPNQENLRGLTSFLYRVQHIAADEAAHSLGRDFAIKYISQKQTTNTPLVVIPNKTSNSLIITTSSQSVSEIKKLLSEIDKRPKQFKIETTIKQTNADGTSQTFAPQIRTIEGQTATIKIDNANGNGIELTVNVQEILPTSTTTAKPVATRKIYPKPVRVYASPAHHAQELKKQIADKLSQLVKPVNAEKTSQLIEREKEIEEALKKKISLHFEKTSFTEVIRHIAGVMNFNVVLDDKGFEEEGLTTDTPVTINVDNIKLGSALKVFLKPLNLDYKIEDEVLKITSKLRAQGPLKTINYPVANLVTAPSPNHSAVSLETLVTLITNLIEPNSWAERGGTGAIHEYSSTQSLVIRQTDKSHEKISKLLDSLRTVNQDDSDAKEIKLDSKKLETKKTEKKKATSHSKGFTLDVF